MGMKISASFFCRAKNALCASLLFVNALCPMMQISASPWRVLDKEHQKAFLAAVRLRQKFAPKIVELAKRAAKDGEPIMRNSERRSAAPSVFHAWEPVDVA